MRSSNPVMNSLTTSTKENPYQNYGGHGAGNPFDQSGQYGGIGYTAPVQSQERPMTVDDVVTKTGITLGVIIVFAVVNYLISTFVNPGLGMLLTMVGAIGGFIMVLIVSFAKKWGSPVVTLVYAALEGLFVGGLSLLLTMYSEQAGVLIGQAVLGTVGVFMGMLFVYKTGAVKVTPRFNKIMLGLIAGVVVLMVGNLILSLFFGVSPLRDGGPLAIVVSIVCIVLAALSFMTDFDAADNLIRAGAPARHAWGVALGLAVTLVWLYTEILRLLSYFNQR